ncbi:MAG: hypothetical protein HZLCBSQH_001527 [Candidatus Fervidibacterota bacterium]
MWAKAFLMQRQKRRQLEGANEEEIVFERWQETTEGVATFASWKAMLAGQEKDYRPLPEMDADDAFDGYRQGPLDGETVAKAVKQGGGEIGHPHASGLAQILLLSGWKRGWQSKVLKERSLEELFGQAMQEVVLSPNLLEEVERSAEEGFKQALEKTRGRLAGAKAPEPRVPIWLYLHDELVRFVQGMSEGLGNPLPGLCFQLSEISLRIAPPVWVASEAVKKRVGILWDVSKQLMVLHRPGGTITLQGDGLVVQGKLQVTWDINGVHVRPVERSQKNLKVSPMMRNKKAWYAVILLVALLAAIASRDTKALQEQETITMEGTITGVFLNAATNQFEMVTLPVPSTDEDYFYADEEEYTFHATFTPSWDPTNPTTTDLVFTVSATYYYDAPPGSPKLVWNFQIGSGPIITIGGRKYTTAIVSRPCPCAGGTERQVCAQLIDTATNQVAFCYPIKKTPPPGQLLVKVFLADGEDIRYNQPFRDVTTEAWYRGKKKSTKVTNADGEALFPELAPGEYILIGRKGRPEPACPQVTYVSSVEKAVSNITSMFFYLHKPIKGRVMEQTSSGAIPLPGAKAYLYKGTEQLLVLGKAIVKVISPSRLSPLMAS